MSTAGPGPARRRLFRGSYCPAARGSSSRAAIGEQRPVVAACPPREPLRAVLAACLLGLAAAPAFGTGDARVELSGQEARELVQEGGPIVLDSVRVLSADAALGLAASSGGISLDGLASLDPASAQALALHGQVSGELPEDLDIEALLARIGTLAEGEDGWPDFSGLEQLVAELNEAGTDGTPAAPEEGEPAPEDEAASQPTSGDPWLSLGGLRSIGPEVAAALALHAGPLLLDGVESLSVEAATALAAHSGELSLAGLQSLPDEVRESLAEHDGPVVIPDELLGAAGLRSE